MDDEPVTTKNPSTPTSGTNAMGKTNKTIAQIYGPVESKEEEEEDAGGGGVFSMTEDDQDLEPDDTEQADAVTAGDGIPGSQLDHRRHGLGERFTNVVSRAATRQLINTAEREEGEDL